jgi:hypothetical protein
LGGKVNICLPLFLLYIHYFLSMIFKFVFWSLHIIISVIKQQAWYKYIICNNETLYWCHWCCIDKSLINILPLMYFTLSHGLLIALRIEGIHTQCNIARIYHNMFYISTTCIYKLAITSTYICWPMCLVYCISFFEVFTSK